MIHRDDLIRMALEAGMTQLMGQTFPGHAMTPDVLERLVSIVAAHIIARQPPPPLVVDAATIDPDLLRSMLAKAPPMPLVPMQTSDAVREAVLAERQACVAVCRAKADEWQSRNTRWQHHQGAAIGALKCADEIEARGAA